MKLSRRELAQMIDYTLIKPVVMKDDVIKLCWEAEECGFACPVVNPTYVSLAWHMLKATDVKVCSTAGFPVGVGLSEGKAFETRKVVELGAEEIDMVINTSALKSKDYEAVKNDILVVLNVKKANSKIIVKVIIGTGLLTNEEKIKACKLVKEAGADFVKNCTSLLGGPATVEDVKLMRDAVGKNMGVKADGGIRTLREAWVMIEAGANRIGTSHAVNTIEELPK